MDEEKSRVILYAKLRKKIENIDVYSFDDANINRKHSAQKVNDNVSYSDEEKQNAKITKNTLSLTIDELIKGNDEYNSKAKKKEVSKKYYDKVRDENKNTPSRIIWFIIFALIVGFVIFLVLLFNNRGR